MRGRYVVAVLVIAAACGGYGTATGVSGSTSASQASSTSGSGGGGGRTFGASSSSCGLVGGGQGGAAAACSGAPKGVSYANDILPIFKGCDVDGVCHQGGWTRQAAVKVSASECCDGRLIVDPGDPSKSYMIDKLNGRVCTGGPMPPAGMIPEAEIQRIVGWICEGAPDN